MQAKVELQPAYVLHTRPYRETSMLVDFITPQHGRVSVVAKGVRSGKRKKQNLLQPFGRILISWYGKGELKSLQTVEDQFARLILHGDALYSGMYVNELLVRLLKTHEQCERFFDSYEQLVQQLATAVNVEPVLRKFEKLLLEELGYGIPFPEESGSDLAAINRWYFYTPEGHFVTLADEPRPEQQQRSFQMVDLKHIAANEFDNPDSLRSAKRLMRLAFSPLLGGQSLRSRELFKAASITKEVSHE